MANPEFALSIWMPWAQLCCTPRPDNPALPIKDCENRWWTTPFRGRIYIHGSKKFEHEALDYLLRKHDFARRHPEAWQFISNMATTWLTGAIIGEVTLVNVLQMSRSEWAIPGQYHWMLANPQLYTFPIPYRGSQRLFRVKL
jgi:hypothetical protein